jgi:anti-sigma regulatory factor (Ser/Thr protein kinase)
MPPTQGEDGHRPLRTDLIPLTAHQLLGKLRVQVDATVTAPKAVRDRVQQWLTDQRWPEQNTEDCVLAVSEAVSDSVEHGYGITVHGGGRPGDSVTVEGHLARADHYYRAVFEVSDQGRWRASPTDPGQTYGWSIMRSCMEDVQINTSDQGTTVSLQSRPATPRIDGASNGHAPG